MVKNLPPKTGDLRDMRSVPGWGRSPGGGHGNLLQYSCWRISCTEEPGRLQAIGSQSRTRLEQVTRTHLLGTNFKFATRRPRSLGVTAINAGGILGFGGGGGG